MFVSNLNNNQQEHLLALSKLLMSADGEVSDEEKTVIDTIKSQCNGELIEINDPFATLDEAFNIKAEKSSLMLELLGVALADSNYHQSEKAFIQRVSEHLNIEQALLESMENWVVKQISLFKEASTFMEE